MKKCSRLHHSSEFCSLSPEFSFLRKNYVAKFGDRMEHKVQSVIDELQVRIKRESEQFSAGQPIDVDQMALAAGPETARFLNLLICTMGAKRIVEVGTSIGYTALWLGEATRATGGQVIGMEAIEAKHKQAV